MPRWFQKVQAGTPTYSAGGFNIVVAEYEKIVSANIQMNPDTKLGTTVQAGFQITLRGNTAVVQVFRRSAGAEAWAELPATFDLNAANFILTGLAE